MQFMVPLNSPPKVDRFNVRLGSQADMTRSNHDVRFTPESGLSIEVVECPLRADKVRCSKMTLFDRLVGQRYQLGGDFEIERLRGGQINDEVELR
jgi:hypothetical protein